MAAVPYLLWGRSVAEALVAHTDAALERWSSEWLPPSRKSIDCAVPADMADLLAGLPDWRHYALSGGTRAWVHVPAGLVRSLEQQLFALNHEDPAADSQRSSATGTRIAQEAQVQLLESVLFELTGRTAQTAPPAAIPPELLCPGSGALLCSVTLDQEAPIRLLLPAGSIRQAAKSMVATKAPPATPLMQALQTTPVTLSVEVCRTEMTLGHLGTLSVGDVLVLPVTIDQPLQVVDPQGTPVCEAHLGSLAGFHAVELVKPNS